MISKLGAIAAIAGMISGIILMCANPCVDKYTSGYLLFISAEIIMVAVLLGVGKDDKDR